MHTHALKRLIDAAKRIQCGVRLNSNAVALVVGSIREAAAAPLEGVGYEGPNRGELLRIRPVGLATAIASDLKIILEATTNA